MPDATIVNFNPEVLLFNYAIGSKTMNKDIVEGNWKQLKGKIKQKWGELTDDDIDQINGNYEILAGRLQETYGLSKDDAERRIKEFNEENRLYM
jgi:uncharacterized protein YjbJ (UPF0337 family)